MFEDDVDVAPGFFNVFLNRDQAIIDHDEIADDPDEAESEDGQNDNGCGSHKDPPVN